MRAILLAGGRGTRLEPYTTVLPKPLMPVGDRPILEILLAQLRSAGITEVTIAVGHLAALLHAYFGDGDRFGMTIEYSYENEPLGTAGPLRLIRPPDEPFLVMNGDLLTDVSFRTLMSAHRASGAVATVGAYRRDVTISLGVLEMDTTGTLRSYVEKPTHHYFASMGVYVLEPTVLGYIPEGGSFDLPDLMKALLSDGQAVRTYLHDGYWLDIGRKEDYERAQIDVARIAT